MLSYEQYFDKVRDWIKPFAVRYPELYLLRVHLVIPLALVSTLLAVAAADRADTNLRHDLEQLRQLATIEASQEEDIKGELARLEGTRREILEAWLKDGRSRQRLEEEQATESAFEQKLSKVKRKHQDAVEKFNSERSIDHKLSLTVGLACSLVAALAWAYFVARDGRRVWPASGWKRMGLLLATAGCLHAMTLPALVYVWLVASDRSALFPLVVDYCSIYEEGHLAGNAYLYLKHSFADGLTIAVGGAGLALALLVVVRENALRLAVTVTVIMVVYFAGFVLFVDDLSLLGGYVTLHWSALIGATTLQWFRRSGSTLARVTGVLLALTSAVIGPAMLCAWKAERHALPVFFQLKYRASVITYELNTLSVVVLAYCVYIACFPLVHGNLARLRFLPEP